MKTNIDASREYLERRDFDGRNLIGRSSGDQWLFHTLYKSRRGQWYLFRESAWQGSRAEGRVLTPREAAMFLALNDYEIPEDLATEAKEVEA